MSCQRGIWTGSLPLGLAGSSAACTQCYRAWHTHLSEILPNCDAGRALCSTEMHFTSTVNGSRASIREKRLRRETHKIKQGPCKQNEQEEEAPTSVKKKLIYSFCSGCTDTGKVRTESCKPERTPAGFSAAKRGLSRIRRHGHSSQLHHKTSTSTLSMYLWSTQSLV